MSFAGAVEAGACVVCGAGGEDCGVASAADPELAVALEVSEACSANARIDADVASSAPTAMTISLLPRNPAPTREVPPAFQASY